MHVCYTPEKVDGRFDVSELRKLITTPNLVGACECLLSKFQRDPTTAKQFITGPFFAQLCEKLDERSLYILEAAIYYFGVEQAPQQVRGATKRAFAKINTQDPKAIERFFSACSPFNCGRLLELLPIEHRRNRFILKHAFLGSLEAGFVLDLAPCIPENQKQIFLEILQECREQIPARTIKNSPLLRVYLGEPSKEKEEVEPSKELLLVSCDHESSKESLSSDSDSDSDSEEESSSEQQETTPKYSDVPGYAAAPPLHREETPTASSQTSPRAPQQTLQKKTKRLGVSSFDVVVDCFLPFCAIVQNVR